MTLHDAMIEVLRRHGGGWMPRDEIARVIAVEGLFTRPSDGQSPPSDQLRLRARKYSQYFECSDTACTRIRLRGDADAAEALDQEPTPRTFEAAAGAEGATAARRRQAATEKYRPAQIKLLLVAEAPPTALDRYFYFEDVGQHDSLFRYVARGILGVEPTRDGKPELLAALRDRGVFLIDLKPEPTSPSTLGEEVPRLIQRVEEMDPDALILIKATVHDAAFAKLRNAGLPVVDERVPFPGSGQQKRFEEAFARALDRTAA